MCGTIREFQNNDYRSFCHLISANQRRLGCLQSCVGLLLYLSLAIQQDLLPRIVHKGIQLYWVANSAPTRIKS